jgi:dihydrofolate synthase/folylpolyglutamate synthase
MTYEEMLDYLYSKLPMFHRIGAAAYKNNLDNTITFCKALDNPENKFRSVHIAGTNGKGSVSHMLSSIFQEAGYKTGLYTSPHLVDFRERIRINGEMISKDWLIQFVEKYDSLIQEISPSFFEVTVAMAFDYFAENKVDIAVIETGLGGRLDSTNVITPELSVITNISYDHQNLLGETLAEIAGEKAGIIKNNIPVVVGMHHIETDLVFIKKTSEQQAKLLFAPDHYQPQHPYYKNGLLEVEYKNENSPELINISSPLAGHYQLENFATVLQAVELLNDSGFKISKAHIVSGIKNVKINTGLRGRWEILGENPLIICDVAHNEAGLKSVFAQVASMPHENLHIVYGMVKDKDITKALSLLPKDATYYFTQPDLPRALEVNELYNEATKMGLHGSVNKTVAMAYDAAVAKAASNDIVIIVGSIFVAAEVLGRDK